MAHATTSSSRSTMSSARVPAVLMIVLGLCALFLPAATGIGISVVFGSAVLLAGLAYGALAFAARGTGTFFWRLLAGIAFTVTGFYLLIHPDMGLATLTLLVAVTFLIEGIAEVASYFALRLLPGSGLLLLNAIFSFVVSFLIWRNWPNSSVWAIGTLVGANLITTGITRLFFAPPVNA